MEHLVQPSLLFFFRNQLIEDEKSSATVDKYMRDVRHFFEYVGENRIVCKATVITYKQYLTEHYAVSSVNSMLASLNCFFKAMDWHDCVVKSIKIQRQLFRPKEKELSKKEYFRLLNTARKCGNTRLYLLMQTLCATGIRVSELRFITIESLRTRQAVVSLKGKTRIVILPSNLCCELEKYAKKRKISRGSIFITRSGNPMDRSNILHAMKALCEEAGVERCKVFPHNLRHLFACLYYKVEKDPCRLADILGHSSVDTTRIYTSISVEEQIRQIEQLGLIIGKKNTT